MEYALDAVLLAFGIACMGIHAFVFAVSAVLRSEDENIFYF